MGQHVNSNSPDDPTDDELRLAPLDPLPTTPLRDSTSPSQRVEINDRGVGDAMSSDATSRMPQYSIRQLLLATTITALILTAIRWAIPELLTVATGIVALGFFAWVSFAQPREPRLFGWAYTLLAIYIALCLGTCMLS